MNRSARPDAPQSFAELLFQLLPFADAASTDLPLPRLLRLSLFQFSVGMATVLLNGTLNRVMVVELGTPTWLVALLIAVPLLVAPFRALIGHKSDTHRSVLGWRRVPYIWFGSLMQFGGLAIMPFALLLLKSEANFTIGMIAAAASFLLTGLGFHTTQTAGLALVSDLAPEDKRARAVALHYVMLLVGMMFSAFVIGGLLADFSNTKLVQVIQGCAVLTIIVNVIAIWKQEARNPAVTKGTMPGAPSFSQLWHDFVKSGRNARLLTAIGIGAAGFAMQDALLEPYGGEILGRSVGATTGLTGAWAFGSLCGFMLSGRALSRGWDPLRLAGAGLVVGDQCLPCGAVRRALCRAADALCRRNGDRGRPRVVLGRHADGSDEPGRGRDRRAGAGRVGRGTGELRRPRHRGRRPAARWGRSPGPEQ